MLKDAWAKEAQKPSLTSLYFDASFKAFVPDRPAPRDFFSAKNSSGFKPGGHVAFAASP
jgi:hypothetical protein